MIIIADAGSSKTKWCFCDKTGFEYNVTTSGINPHHLTPFLIKEIIETELLSNIEIPKEKLKTLFFYGSGISSEKIKSEMLSVFKSVFRIDDINIFSDLLGTCRSLFGNNKGIAAILGTGSNSCLYDGEKIISNIPPLGYILGDEGSGAHLGKTLVSDLLKDQLPEELKKMFFEEFETSKDLILENVYRKPNANKYLASLSLFLKNHIEEPECYDIVFKCFSQFFERNILQYESSEIHTISFTGSVAENYNEVLFHVCEHYGMNIGKIENNPISGLIKFHLNQSL